MNLIRYSLLISLILVGWSTYGQESVVEGYVFESNNRGFLNLAKVSFTERGSIANPLAAFSDKTGLFTIGLKPNTTYDVKVEKDLFFEYLTEVKTGAVAEKVFMKVELNRKPGYIFDVTLAPKRTNENVAVDAISGAHIEIFNNTTDKEELDLIQHPSPHFNFTLERGHHYTVMIRKPGYLTKRVEAYVDVDGCILCFDGLGTVNPGVSDNIHETHDMGTLLANIEMEEVNVGSKFVVENIYYNFNKYNIRPDAAIELNKLATVLKDNPKLIVELGSHTDSRGKDDFNMELSQNRARAAVNYLIKHGIDESRISSKGYGETQIINRCHNGVDCTEEEHQENRRTELKVVGMRAEEEFMRKPLSQIIREEKALEKAFDESAIVEVKEGEEMPDDLKAYIESQKGEAEKDKIEMQILETEYNGYSILISEKEKRFVKAKEKIEGEYDFFIHIEDDDTYYLLGKFEQLIKANEVLGELKESFGVKGDVLLFRNGKIVK